MGLALVTHSSAQILLGINGNDGGLHIFISLRFLRVLFCYFLLDDGGVCFLKEREANYRTCASQGGEDNKNILEPYCFGNETTYVRRDILQVMEKAGSMRGGVPTKSLTNDEMKIEDKRPK